MILHDKCQGRTEEELCDARGLFEHLFEGQSGYLNTFTGKQLRFVDPDTHANELTAVRNRTWKYPEQASEAVESLLAESGRKRDAYFGVHLFEERQPGRRLASNAARFVRSLWVDGDGALVPDHYPPPTAIVHSSSNRHHFYWRLSEPVPVDQAVALNRRMATDMGADTSKASKASVLRLPGTFNYKRETPEPVAAEITDQSIEYADMDAAVPQRSRRPGRGRRNGGRGSSSRPKGTSTCRAGWTRTGCLTGRRSGTTAGANGGSRNAR